MADPINPTLQSLFKALDPISLILSHNSLGSDQHVPLQLTSDTYYIFERGPRYRAYADLRDSKLKIKHSSRHLQTLICDPKQTPPKKQVKFQPNNNSRKVGGGGYSVLAQSVPDFSATLRKENRKPPPPPVAAELTPPSKNWSNSRGGSKSANGGEKRNGMLMARKSYASVEELKGLSMAASAAINGENRGGRIGRGGVSRTVLGYRQL